MNKKAVARFVTFEDIQSTVRSGKLVFLDHSTKLTPLAKEFLSGHPEVLSKSSTPHLFSKLRSENKKIDLKASLPPKINLGVSKKEADVLKASTEPYQGKPVKPTAGKRSVLLAGNWKMHKTVSQSVALVNELKKSCANVTGREILVCPPTPSLALVNEILRGTAIQLGAQNLHWEAEGAFTGEISGAMLKDAGCQYVIVGHSERRQYFGETDEFVNKKMKAAFKAGLIPIVCVGERLEERERGAAFKVVEQQMRNGVIGLQGEFAEKLVIAYEPVWAIGTGKTATPQQAQEMHVFIRKLLAEIYGNEIGEKIRILYGGSIKPDNIDSLMAQQDIDGGLIGGASLKAEDFTRIVKYNAEF